MADYPAPPEWGFPDGSVAHDDGTVTLPDGSPWQPGDPIPSARTLTARGDPRGQGIPAQQASRGADLSTNVPPAGATTSGGIAPGSLLFTTPPPGPANFQPGAPPAFKPPGYTPPPAFRAPTPEEAANDPGYQFSLKQGEQALQQSAAARGTLNTGGTLKDILNYGQQAATQQYGNVFNRARDVYSMNYGTQYTDPYKFAYQSALDAYMPSFNAWQTATGIGANQSAANQTQAYNVWNDLYRQNQDLFHNAYQVATG